METVIIIALVILVFLVCREIVCWYWKINLSVALLTEIRDILAANGFQQAGKISTGKDQTRIGVCPYCTQRISLDCKVCPKCNAQVGPNSILPL